MPNRDFDMVSSNSMECLESPLSLLPDVQPVFSIQVAGSETIDSPTMKLFKGSKDISGTNLSGNMSVNGRTITCKQIISLTPGDYAFYVTFNDGGQQTERFCRFTVAKEGA